MIRKIKVISNLVFVLFILGCSTNHPEDIHLTKEVANESEFEDIDHYIKSSYATLENVLLQRKNELKEYSKLIFAKVNELKKDELLNSFFYAKNEYWEIQKTTAIPQEVKNDIAELKQAVKTRYIKNYMSFYDLMFINLSGDVFYTVRQEEDYHKNIFEGTLAKTDLSKRLKKSGKESFIDFKFYDVSGEPSAFFVEPVMKDDNLQGWMVVQFALNKINNIFLDHQELGKTGEVILVNKEHYMLTDSRFNPRSTVLRQKLSEENISSKFKEGKGRKEVIDYNGNKVYSVFEVVEFFGGKWLIICKITQAEVFTNYYKKYKSNTVGAIIERVSNEKFINKSCRQYADKNRISVDMDEFCRIDSAGVLYTHGVSSCTGVIAVLPGKFAYMAHISPYDDIYGESRTDILSQILKRIDYYEVPEIDKQNIRFYILSQSSETVPNVIDKVLDTGYMLSNIYALTYPHKRYADIYYDFDKDCLYAEIVPESNTNEESFFISMNELKPINSFIIE